MNPQNIQRNHCKSSVKPAFNLYPKHAGINSEQTTADNPHRIKKNEPKSKFCGIYYLVAMLVGLYSHLTLADPNMAEFTKTVTGTFQSLGKIMLFAASISGLGFAIMGLLKFKAYKDNPAQIPLSTPIILIAVSSGLLFLPTVAMISGSGIFGTDAKSPIKIEDIMK